MRAPYCAAVRPAVAGSFRPTPLDFPSIDAERAPTDRGGGTIGVAGRSRPPRP
jgi:hypothetical protein